ncbi:MAG: hypothetical protein H0V53_06380 [Rubrobacter sp.]|jgi:hypothetical protein|nr:hypothetical protein [Rubrobacter sp.]
MWLFNRIAVSVLLAGLLALGIFAVLYGFGIAGYSLANLPQALGLPGIVSGLQGFLGGVEGGSPGVAGVAVLVAVAVVGLVLLILELKPSRPRKVRLQDGVFATRSAVREEVEAAAERTPQVLESKARVKARRRPGAKVKLQANVRRGEDLGGIKSNIQESVQSDLQESGVPVGKLKLDLLESDPQGTKARVS